PRPRPTPPPPRARRWRTAARGPGAAPLHPTYAPTPPPQALAKPPAPFAQRALAMGRAAVAARLEPQEGARARVCSEAATLLTQAMAKATPGDLPPLVKGLSAVAARLEPNDAVLMFVELLTQPTCIGPAGRAILDQLENRYRRKFADHWAFVRFAQEQNLGLDFTSPPRRIALQTSRPEQ